MEFSICTGEKTIGFYSSADKKLYYAELVRTNSEILAPQELRDKYKNQLNAVFEKY